MQTINYQLPTTLFQQFQISLIVQESFKNMALLKDRFMRVLIQIKTKLTKVSQLAASQNDASPAAGKFRWPVQNQLYAPDLRTIQLIAERARRQTDGYFDQIGDQQPASIELMKSWLIDEIFNEDLKPLIGGPVIGVWLNADEMVRTAVEKGSNYQWPIRIYNSLAENELLERDQLANGGIVTLNAKALARSQSPIKQLTVIGQRVSDAVAWAVAGINAGTGKFLRLINQHRLSGILIDRALGVIAFQSGRLTYKQA
ncbi:hypothetical protein [Lentilactobacillus farraginis]|uniref:FAD:protein FMN transferase n=1 Tax=Lentilactobacillus farraginis DSM 18382 = JCM 14108 TaxID=1423743 RepID=X0PA83_9LACO|nr:hypothetical protein [Lentilactobacillus farraginis]KRM11512.1 hypothetical protein FD41_GL001370 [Lentilactobacillus farraginis DSM 18382 = JCM 14108]GAF36123.1 hypothetical protein JCM14108_1071 [Lentilactobacillus farraginis DSM 18382 = JCM 14108]